MTWPEAGSQTRHFPERVEVFVGEVRKIRSESEARRCLAAVKAARVSVKEWARARGIDGRSLHAWQMNLARAQGSDGGKRRRAANRTPSAPSMRLVELVPAATQRSSRYVLHIGAVAVELSDDFDAQTLRRIVEVLRSC
jgi:hypothetical protein